MVSYLNSSNPRVGINKNCKYFIATLIETIYFDFGLVIGKSKLNDMNEFVPVSKHMKDMGSKIPIHPVKKNPNK